MFLNEDIVDIEKPDEICSPAFEHLLLEGITTLQKPLYSRNLLSDSRLFSVVKE